MASAAELNTRSAEANLLIDGSFPFLRVPNENLEEIDDGLLTGLPTEKETGLDGSPRLGLPTDEYPITHTKPKVRPPLDMNLYATKKTVAQGMMDLALFTANANQLRYVLESGSTSPFFYVSVGLISLSIILQLVSGVVLIFLGRYNLTDENHAYKSETLNNWVVVLVFLITAINVFISAFGIDPVEKMDPVLIVDAALRSLKADRLEIIDTL